MLKADHEIKRQIYAMRGVAAATVMRAKNYAAFVRGAHRRSQTRTTEHYHDEAQKALARARSALDDLTHANCVHGAAFDFERVCEATFQAAEMVDAANQLLENN